MPDTLLIGSGNRDKAAELAVLLEDLPWRVVSLRDFPPVTEPEEDGDTFEANARKKAQYYSVCFGVACVADDSGLIVDALGGAPGVWSARYAGEGCSYADNNAKLLRELDGIPEAQRTARFVCCATLILPDGRSHVTTGTVEGRIIEVCQGTGGFGYDPLFLPDGQQQTFGELDAASKHAISHRGRAFVQMRAFLETL